MRLRLIAELGDAVAPTRPSLTSLVARGDNGHLFVANGADPDVIVVYDSTGAYRRAIGEVGPGNRLLRGGVSAIAVGPGNTLHAFAGKHFVFDQDGKLVATHEIVGHEQVNEAIITSEGALVLQAMISTDGRSPKPLHIAESDGSLVASIGGTGNELYFEAFASTHRRLASRPSGGFVSATINKYELSTWTGDGTRERSYERTPSWFVEWSPWSRMPMPQVEVPRPMVRSLAVDSQDRVWVAVLVPDAHWRPTPSVSEESFLQSDWWNGAFDTVIEIVDLRTGRLVASQRLSNAFRELVAPGLIAEYRVDQQKRGTMRIWRIDLIRPQPEGKP
jgi:hypothetical protein